MKDHRDLEADVERQLKEGNWKYVREPVIGDTRPDFLVTTSTGHQIVIEVKPWESSDSSTARAVHQSQMYQRLSGAAAALIVTASGEAKPLSSGGTVPVGAFLPALGTLAQKLAETQVPAKLVTSGPSPTKRVFASMPFAGKYDDTFFVAIQPAALALNAVAERVDHGGQAGDVVMQIKQMIKAAKVVVADLSELRPNVLHEVGYADAAGKPVIQLCSPDVSTLPFNVRNNQTIPYTIGQVTKLRGRLEEELRKLL